MQTFKDLMDKLKSRNGTSVEQSLRTWSNTDKICGSAFLHEKYNGVLDHQNEHVSGFAKANFTKN